MSSSYQEDNEPCPPNRNVEIGWSNHWFFFICLAESFPMYQFKMYIFMGSELKLLFNHLLMIISNKIYWVVKSKVQGISVTTFNAMIETNKMFFHLGGLSIPYSRNMCSNVRFVYFAKPCRCHYIFKVHKDWRKDNFLL